MHRIVFAGTGMPLEKCLTLALPIQGISIVKVYIDPYTDKNILNICRNRNIETDDITVLAIPNITHAVLPPHDYFFCVNSTRIFPEQLLNIPIYGALNMHPGRLPDYAGLHTHQWAIKNGETRFASTLHWMTNSIDAGDIAYMAPFDIKPKETGISLFIKCLSAGASLVVKALKTIAQGDPLPRIPQSLDKRKVYKHKDALDGRIDWTWRAERIERFIRALDYGFFTSPTCPPVLHIGGGQYIVKKATIVELDSPPTPGQIVEIDADHICIGSGDGHGISITHLRAVDDKHYKSNFSSIPGMELGMVLSNEKI